MAQDHANVVTNFLNVDEAAALRDSLEQMRQSTYETDASFNRRFRNLAHTAFPAPVRNDDQWCGLMREVRNLLFI